jgi:hypothetical protein
MASRLLLFLFLIFTLAAKPRQSIHVEQIPELVVPHSEEVEWTWEARPAHVDPKLPKVLLVGASITRNYYPDVARKLTCSTNIYYSLQRRRSAIRGYQSNWQDPTFTLHYKSVKRIALVSDLALAQDHVVCIF